MRERNHTLSHWLPHRVRAVLEPPIRTTNESELLLILVCDELLEKNYSLAPAGIDKMTEQEEAHKMSMDMEGSSENPEKETQETADRRKERLVRKQSSISSQASTREQSEWRPTPEWVISWKQKLPLQTIMRLLQVLVPQVEKICIDK